MITPELVSLWGSAVVSVGAAGVVVGGALNWLNKRAMKPFLTRWDAGVRLLEQQVNLPIHEQIENNHKQAENHWSRIERNIGNLKETVDKHDYRLAAYDAALKDIQVKVSQLVEKGGDTDV